MALASVMSSHTWVHIGDFFSYYCAGTDHRVTSAYHPQTNGLVERLNQTVQNTLLKLVNEYQNNWDDLLDTTLFAIRTSKQKSTKYTPFEMMFNRYLQCHVNRGTLASVNCVINLFQGKRSY